jgi:RNA polymerase sigma factor (sigma-70 family)
MRADEQKRRTVMNTEVAKGETSTTKDPWQLVEQNQGLVWWMAKKMYPLYRQRGLSLLELDDFVQEGLLGLWRAAEKFDPAAGFQFSTYASFWIRRAMRRAVVNQARVIRLPSEILAEQNRLNRIVGQYWQQGTTPSVEALATIMGCSKERIVCLLVWQQDVKSLQQPLTVNADEEENHLGDLLAAPDTSIQREAEHQVQEMLACLSPVEQQVIEHRYQIGSQTEHNSEDIPLTFTEVARRLNMTTERVKSVEARALLKMRYWAAQGGIWPLSVVGPVQR